MTDITILEEVNGIGRGWSVEPVGYDDRGILTINMRFILWDLDEPDKSGRRRKAICDIVEMDLSYVQKNLKPRAGFRVRWLQEKWGIERLDPAPILKVIETIQMRRAEEASS